VKMSKPLFVVFAAIVLTASQCAGNDLAETRDHRMDEEGLKVSAAFQKFLVDEPGFAPKAYLIGMSWGGFFSVRYTVANPLNVEKIYLDAPLLSFVDFQLIKDIGPWNGKMPEEGGNASSEMPLNMASRLART